MPGMSVFFFCFKFGPGDQIQVLMLVQQAYYLLYLPKDVLFALRQDQIILWVVKDDLECLILHPPPSECWDYGFVPPCLAQQLFLYQHLCVAISPIPYVPFESLQSYSDLTQHSLGTRAPFLWPPMSELEVEQSHTWLPVLERAPPAELGVMSCLEGEH